MALSAIQAGALVGVGVVSVPRRGPDIANAHMMLVRADDVAYKAQFDTWKTGKPTDGVLRFLEGQNGQTTWAQNVAITDTTMDGLKTFPLGMFVDYVIPLATGTAVAPVETMQQTAAGLKNNEILGIVRKICATSAAELIVIRLGHEALYQFAYPHSATYAADRKGLYLAAFRYIAPLLKAIDPRIRIAWCLQPQTTDYTGGIANFRDYYPGDDFVDIICGDNYWVATDVDNETGAEAFDLRVSQINGFNGQYAFAMERGKWFSLNENGWSANKPEGFLAWIHWMRERKIAHFGYWDQGLIGDASGFACRLSNDQYPLVSAVAKREWGPTTIITPASLSAPPGPFDVELEANKWGMNWSIVDGPDGQKFKTEDGRVKSHAPLVAGLYQFIVRATDERGQAADQLVTLNVAAGAHLPETQFYAARCTVAPDEAMLTAIDGVISALKLSGVWWKTEQLFLRLANNQQQTKVNVRQARFDALVSGGAPVFTARAGVKGDGASASEDTGYLLSMPGRKTGRDSFYIGLHSLTDLPNGAGASYEMGGGGALHLMRAANGQIRGRPASFTEFAIAPAGSFPGLVAMNRSGPTAWQGFAGNAQTATGADASTRFLYDTVKLLANPTQNNWGVNAHAAEIIAGSLTLNEHQAVNAALAAYVAALRT